MSDAVILPDGPPLGGLAFRSFRDAQDYLGMAAVHAGAQRWDQVDPLSAREHVPTATDLAATFPEDNARGHLDLLLALIDDTIVGYAHVWWRWTETIGTRVYLHLGYLLPAWRGRGIGSTMLRWSQRRIRELMRDQQHRGPATFATNVSSTEREADQLIRQDGYHAVRRLSDMALTPLAPPPPMALPPGITLRPLEPLHYREVYRAWKDAFAELWTSTPESEEDFGAFVDDNLSGPLFDPSLCHIAWAADQVAGLVFTRLRQRVGTIPEVAVRTTWRRRRLARALMAQALTTLHERGATQVRLFTDADNGQGARSLYEQLGFRELKQHIFYRKPIAPEPPDPDAAVHERHSTREHREGVSDDAVL